MVRLEECNTIKTGLYNPAQSVPLQSTLTTTMRSTLPSPGITANSYQSFSSPRSSYGSKSDHAGIDPEELTRLLRRVRKPSQDEMTARYEARAKQYYDELVEMGARPTRPLQLQPIWTATYKNGLIYIIDNEGALQCTLSDDIDPMSHHWRNEGGHFREELENWQKFRANQQKLQHFDRLETELELENTDAGLIKALTSSNDWQEFEVFQYRLLADALTFEDQFRQDLLYMMKWEVTTEQPPLSYAAHDAIGPWLRPFNRIQEEIEAAKEQMKWIKDQWPKVVAEAVESISTTPKLQSTLEAKFRKQTHAAFSAIEKLGGRPSHAVSPPDESMDYLHRLLYWSSETSKYMEELLGWKMFLEWRWREQGEKSPVPRGEYQCPQFQSVLDFFAEFESFRQFEHELAFTWLRCWQRLVRWSEEESEKPRWYVDEFATTPPDGPPEFLYDHLKAQRSHLRDSEQKLADAATRLEKSRQEHTHALSEHGQSIDGENAIGCPQNQPLPTPPLSGSDSLHFSQSSSSPSSQSSSGVPSPQSSHSSQPSQSSDFPSSLKSPQPPEHVSKYRKPPSKGSSVEKLNRRSKKKNTRKKGTKISTIDTEQQALPAFALESHNVEGDVDIQMTDALINRKPAEPIENPWSSESEDTVMTDPEESLNHISSHPSQPHSRLITNTKTPKSPSTPQGPPRRKTRSATKLEQPPPSRVLKNTKKKPAKKSKDFTEQQATMLLNAASNKESTTDCPSLRRSERLKEKAAVSPATTASSQLNPVPSFQSPQQEQPQEDEPSPIAPPQPSEQQQPQKQPNPINKPSASSKQRKPKIQHHKLEPSQNARRMRKKKRRMQSKTLELSQT